MSTRALLTFRDEHDTCWLFRHHDGYPESKDGVLHDLQLLVNSDLVWPLPRFEADEFVTGFVARFKLRAGNYRFSKGPQAHGDIEFWYDISAQRDELVVEWHGHGKSGTVRIRRAS